MQKSLWWWQCSVRYSPPLPPPPGISGPTSTSLETTQSWGPGQCWCHRQCLPSDDNPVPSETRWTKTTDHCTPVPQARWGWPSPVVVNLLTSLHSHTWCPHAGSGTLQSARPPPFQRHQHSRQSSWSEDCPVHRSSWSKTETRWLPQMSCHALSEVQQ